MTRSSFFSFRYQFIERPLWALGVLWWILTFPYRLFVPARRKPLLTDEEREAVRFFSLIDGPHNVPVANIRAATLRRLLERTA